MLEVRRRVGRGWSENCSDTVGEFGWSDEKVLDAGELRQMARETFGKYYGDKVQSELVHNFAKYGLVLHKGENNNVQIYGREDMFK